MVFPKMRIWLHEPIEREQTVLNMATMMHVVDKKCNCNFEKRNGGSKSCHSEE